VGVTSGRYARHVSDAVSCRSARDLPTVAELLGQLAALKLLTTFVARDQRGQIQEMERELNDLVNLVDRFYDLLGKGHWVFHESMDVEAIKLITAQMSDAAESALIAYYKDPVKLRFMLSRLALHDQIRPRMALLERALDDYASERYYAAVMVLLAVMDGFVNDVDATQRRGLHTRSAEEMTPWDSVAGHHLGLGRAHRTFTKTFGKCSDEEVHELYRNGIVHGMLTNFDNEIVATKAWNRLFAVGDWATSREKQAAPTGPEASWTDLFKQIVETDRLKKAINDWQPRSATNPAALAKEPLYARAGEFLSAWQTKNYGEMARFLTKFTREDTHGKTAGLVRDQYSHVQLDRFQITRLDFQGPASCEVDAELVWNDSHHACRLRWIKEDEQGEPHVLDDPGAEWRLMSFGPEAIVNSRQAGESAGQPRS
jgi:hypothetical protein